MRSPIVSYEKRSLMSQATNEFSAGQEFVYVDVGGTTFKMLRQTVRNYPDSLLATLLRECPDFGKQGQPVYIDRSPASFKWILEVYRSASEKLFHMLKQCFRNGDYDGAMPRKSAEYLQRELDFYQLPSLDELRLSNSSREVPSSADMASKMMMREIMQEIRDGGMADMYPWCVYIYYHLREGDSRAEKRIFVLPEALRSMGHFKRIVDFIKGKRNIDFGAMLSERRVFYLPKSSHCPYQSSLDGKTTFLIQFPTDELVEMLREEAQGLGLSVEARNVESVKDNATGKNIDFTELPFMHCSFMRK